MINPLRPNAPQTSNADRNLDLQKFCDDNNARAQRMGADWFYHVVTRKLPDGSPRREVAKTEGLKAIEMRNAQKAASTSQANKL
jgi:hypothetical protein